MISKPDQRITNLEHHQASGCCMWSGIEDLYATRTGEILPDGFLFALSSFGEAILLKQNNVSHPYMFGVADGRTYKTYNSIKDNLGLEYKISVGRTLEYAIKSVQTEIDQGRPVIVGPLDMYYLPYLKMYHKFHIPIHYILLVGYNKEKEIFYCYDCDREDEIVLPMEDLMKAWQVEKNVVGDKNGFVKFSLPNHPTPKFELAKQCLKQKANRQLCEKPNFVGCNAFYKVAKEFPLWENQLSDKAYKNTLFAIASGCGRVPKLPNALMGIKGQEDIIFDGNYGRLGQLCIDLGQEYNHSNFIKAGELFCQNGELLIEVTKHIVENHCDQNHHLNMLPQYFTRLGDNSKEAYQILKED